MACGFLTCLVTFLQSWSHLWLFLFELLYSPASGGRCGRHMSLTVQPQVSVTCYSDHVSSDRTLLTTSHISSWKVWAPILYLCGFWGEGLQNPSGEYSQGRNQLLPFPLRAEQEEPGLFLGKRDLGWKLGSASGKWEGGYVCFTEVTYVLELFDCLGRLSTLDTTLMGFLAPKTCLHP